MLKEGQTVQVVSQESPMSPINREAQLYYGLYARGYEYRQRHPDAFPNSPDLFDIKRLTKSNLVSQPPTALIGDQSIDAVVRLVTSSCPKDSQGRHDHFQELASALGGVTIDTDEITGHRAELFFDQLADLDRNVPGGLAYLSAYAFGMSEFKLRLKYGLQKLSEEPDYQDSTKDALQIFDPNGIDPQLAQLFLTLRAKMGVDPVPSIDLARSWSHFGFEHVRVLKPIIDEIIALADRNEIPIGALVEAMRESRMSRYFSVEMVTGKSISDFMDGSKGIFVDRRSLLSLRVPGPHIDTHLLNRFVPLALWLQKEGPNGLVNFTPIIKLVRPTDEGRLLAAYAGQRNEVDSQLPTEDSPWHDAFTFKRNKRTGYAEAELRREEVGVVGLPLGICEGTLPPWNAENRWTQVYGLPRIGLRAAYRTVVDSVNATPLHFAQSAD